jgi:hypothetical protein
VVGHIDLSSCLCNAAVLNVYAPCEENSDDSKDKFCEELEQVFDNFPKCH